MARTEPASAGVRRRIGALCAALVVASCAANPAPAVLSDFANDWSQAGPPREDHSMQSEKDMAPWRGLWDFADPAASEARLREAEAAADGVAAAELRTQVARALGLQQRFDEARAELAAAARDLPSTGAARVRVLLELERGRLARSSGDLPGAIAPFESAFERANAAGLDYLAVDAAHMLGIAETGDAASLWNRRALGIAHASSDPSARGWGAVIANNEGWNQFEATEHAAALELFEQALVLRRERPEQVEPIWIARWAVARAHRELGRVEEALAEQEALMAEREAANAPDGYVFEEVGECLLLLERADEATPFFARAHELLAQDAWLVANEPERLARLERLAR
ncbi:hypothetical protein Pla163_32740 [Planctomycetes bacterium Pla163]|uniref:Tetratricopeptide repeat protein n=2 Tax=Rohdeia mirabilis TaxID=2528008 RepID=A0A518D3S7_9BACT|nr:hypothetical protein Pla163_32740 [Planctomycetes bacterium Pla163]